MSANMEPWSVLEGKTLLHIEAPNGVTLFSMAKKRRGEAYLVSRLPDLLNALFAWRSAEIHAAAILIGLRTGDHDAAKQVVSDRETELRILADHLHQKTVFMPAGPEDAQHANGGKGT